MAEDRSEAMVVGGNESIGIAVLQLTSPSSLALPTTIPLGDSSSVRIGQSVKTIGNFFNLKRRSLTTGVVSNAKLNFKTKDGKTLPNVFIAIDGEWFEHTNHAFAGVLLFEQNSLLSIKAHIYQGTSGAPVLDTQGRLIGVCTYGVDDDGMSGNDFGLAVTVDVVASVVNETIGSSGIVSIV